MKYIRKAIALILAAVFIAALAIGLSVIFAVRNVNIFRISYASGEEQTVSSEFENAVARNRKPPVFARRQGNYRPSAKTTYLPPWQRAGMPSSYLTKKFIPAP